MVALSTVQTSNARIPSNTTLVAVFIGATSGIGKSSLLQFVRHTAQNKLRIYFVGRSQAAADEILQQLRDIKPESGGGAAEYTFIQADVSLLRQVDEVCKQIKKKETMINLLLLSQGTLDMSTETSEHLSLILALSYFSRMRFIANLLPLLQTATSTTSSPSMNSRVISVMAGTKEGPIDASDIAGKNVAPWKSRGHLCSMTTLSMEHFAEHNDKISFVHSYPGFVDTGLGRSMTGVVGSVMKAGFLLAKPLLRRHYVPFEDCGDRYVFLATSPRYSRLGPSSSSSSHSTDALETAAAAIGSNGQIGSGVYSVDETCEPADARVQAVLEELRQNGVKDKVWQHLQGEFVRITGTSAMVD